MADHKSREVIGGKRMCGKTTELIKRANKENLYILCANKKMANAIFIKAKEMDLSIPYPITVYELPLKESNITEVLIDEAEMVLRQLIGVQVVGMSTSYELKELPNVNEDKVTKVSDKASYIRSRIVNSGIDHCKSITPEQMETVVELTKEYEEQAPREKQPLLTIELQDETSVPKVIYKGEKIDGKKRVSFDWETDTDIMGGLTYAIEHFESGSYPVFNRIERKIKGHSVY